MISFSLSQVLEPIFDIKLANFYNCISNSILIDNIKHHNFDSFCANTLDLSGIVPKLY